MTEQEKRYKCHTCYLILKESDLINGNCPKCGMNEGLIEMCPNDHCHCSHDLIETIAFCPICGEPMCPICGCHDVEGVSRVTGYMASVSGFSAGKRQELKDRKRYEIATDKKIKKIS
jgi:hypothetical protein